MDKEMYEKLLNLSKNEFNSNATSRLGKKNSNVQNIKISIANRGRIVSEETRKKLASSNAGKKPTKFAREYASLVHKNVAKSTDHKTKIGRANSKKICTPLQVFNSINEVASAYKVSRIAVYNWLKKSDSGFYYADKQSCFKRILTPIGVFNNIGEVAIAYNVKKGTVHTWLKCGKEGFLKVE